jgi:WD40 repeat protein
MALSLSNTLPEPLINDQEAPREVSSAMGSQLNLRSVRSFLTESKKFQSQIPEISPTTSSSQEVMSCIEDYVSSDVSVCIPVPSPVFTLDVTADTSYLILGTSSGEIGVYHVVKETLVSHLHIADKSISAIKLSRDETLLFVSADSNVLHVYSFPELNLLKLFEHDEAVRDFVIDKETEYLYSSTSDGAVKKWNLSTFQDEGILMEFTDSVENLAIDSKSAYLFAASRDTVIRVYDLHNARELEPFENEWPVTQICVSDDGELLAAGDAEGHIQIWNLRTFMSMRNYYGHAGPITSLCFTKLFYTMISGSTDSTIRIWSYYTERPEIILSGHKSNVNQVIVASNGKIAYSCSMDSTIRIWSIMEFGSDEYLTSHKDKVVNICNTHNGRYLFSTCVAGTHIKVWDTQKHTHHPDLKGHESPIVSLCVSGDDLHLLSLDNGGKLSIWDINKLSLLTTIQSTDKLVKSIACSLDGKNFFTGSIDGNISIFRFADLELEKVLVSNLEEVISIKLHPDNAHLIASSSNNLIYIWNIITHQLIKSLKSHTSIPRFLSITHNGDFIISAESKNQIKIWDYSTRVLLTTFSIKGEGITSLNVSKDSRYLIVTALDGGVIYYDLYTMTYLTHLDYSVLSCQVDPEEHYLYLGVDKRVLRVENPLAIKELRIYGPRYIRYPAIEFLKEVMVAKGYPKYEPEIDDILILPFMITTRHIYAYYNQTHMLKHSLMNNCQITSARNGSTPLSISLERQMNECVDVLLKVVKKNISSNMYLGRILESCIVQLNLKGHELLPSLYDSIFVENKSHSTPKYCVSSLSLPKVYHSDSISLDYKNFCSKDDLDSDGKNMVFKQSMIKYNMSVSSETSIDFLKSLLYSSNQEIFKVEFVKHLIEDKWKRLRWALYLQGILYLSYLAILSFTCFTTGTEYLYNLILLSANSVLLLYSLIQMLSTGGHYWSDLWNYIDILRSMVCYVFVLSSLKIFETPGEYYLFPTLILLSWFSGVSYFRLFQPTRYLLQLLYKVCKDIRAFLLILLYSIAAFTLVFTALSRNRKDTAFSKNLLLSYQLNFGDIQDSQYDILEWVVMSLIILVNPIILLNLLISIIIDTHSKVQKEIHITDMQQVADMVLKVELMRCFSQKNGRARYLQVCEEKSKGPSQTEEPWEKRVRKLERRMMSLEAEVIRSRDMILKKLDKHSEASSEVSNN